MKSVAQLSHYVFYVIKLYVHGFIEMLLQPFSPVKSLPDVKLRPKSDILGRVVIITGGTSGIGLEISKQLAGRGMQVIAAGLNPINQEDQLNYGLTYLHLDLAAPNSINDFVTNFCSRHTSLDYLVNNAGVMLVPYQQVSGNEMHYAVNYLGHVLLTEALLPKLSSSSIHPKVINVCSSVHQVCLGIDPQDYCNVTEADYSPHLSYALSKLALAIYTADISQQHNIQAFAVHPGVVSSDLYRHVWLPLQFIQRWILAPLFFRTVSEGALVVINCLLSDSPSELSGCYVDNGRYFPLYPSAGKVKQS